jgi:cytidylate kinase
MSVITISRQFGAGGKTLGQMIAKELNYRFLDDIIIHELSKESRVSVDSIISMERTAGSKLSKLISVMLSSGYIERIIGADKGYIDEKKYVELLHKVIKNFAKQDNVVLLGRGGQYILHDFTEAYHILLIADWQDRIKFMQQFYDMSEAKAKKAVKQGETRRSNLYKNFGREDYNQPHLYHLGLNMSRLTLEQALKEVIVLVQE